ncbi:MLP-like protein 328 [Senna tora]|uniref:MLP-like protein 328 n=1 Tax=Senna tora TaxID=362788 RepID=A0A834TW75_9FABA|nr:MLP-like protein 328 [Senna tora]
MAQVGVLETTAQLKSPAEKFYKLLRTQNQQIPSACTDMVHDVEVLEGDIKLWKFSIEGKEEVMKARIEVDEANKSLTYVAVGGNIRELYKSYRVIIKTEMSGNLKLRLEYEKLNEQVPPPNKYLQFTINLMKQIDQILV